MVVFLLDISYSSQPLLDLLLFLRRVGLFCFVFSEELCEDELDVLLYGFELASALARVFMCVVCCGGRGCFSSSSFWFVGEK